MIEFAADRPIWIQIVEIIRGRIEDGTYRPRQIIPSEAQMIGEFGVARSTVRKAIRRLREDGVIYTVPQIGSFVSPRDEG